MLTSSLALFAALAPGALAWNTHQVNVGKDSLAYDPPFIYAGPGDHVEFIFNPKNHTVTQSAFDPPCVPLAGGQGFETGFVPVSNGTYPLPTKDFVVPDNNGQPLWFYCRQTGHCGKGMVFAINPPTNVYDPHSFNAFKALAIARNGTVANYTAPASPLANDGECDAPAAAAASAVGPTNHRIIVGVNGTLAYGPANITAAVGDTVTFEFHPKNHTVTQSSFENPCSPLINLDGTIGFNSGFNPVSANDTIFPTITITVPNLGPIWGYCGQTGHCKAGMVFSINANGSGSRSFEAFLALATSNTTTSLTNSTTTKGTAAIADTPGGMTKPCSWANKAESSVVKWMMPLFCPPS